MSVDLDKVDDVAANSRLFSHNKSGLISIQDKDHGFRDGRPLRTFVEDALVQQNLAAFNAKIIFVTIPRLLGFAFNPISFYYCYDDQGRLGAVMHQVKNTFGGQIGYLLPVHGDGLIRQTTIKRMYVSPFFDMQGGYRFALTPPGEKLSVSIQYGDSIAKRMTATMKLHAKPFTDASILRLLAEMPFAPMKVMMAIHWQALKIFVRGAKFHSVPTINHETVIAGESE